MESASLSKQHYRPLFTLLRIGRKEYAVLDQPLAKERARTHLARALYLLEAEDAERHINTINSELLVACDLGSADAAFLLACRTIEDNSLLPFPGEDAVLFLKLAAERGHAESAYQLACCYASMGQSKTTERVCANYFDALTAEERARFAEHYFSMAIELNHREAIEELIIAYAYGRGYITKNAESFVNLCEKLVERGEQSVALGYGAWLAGMTVEGEPLLPEAVHLPQDDERALASLMIAANGADISLAQHALYLICLGLYNGNSAVFSSDYVETVLKNAIDSGNQLIALYFAWYAIPMHLRGTMPLLLEEQQLTLLACFVEQDESLAMQYLDKALIGENHELSSIAKELLLQTFNYASSDSDVELAN